MQPGVLLKVTKSLIDVGDRYVVVQGTLDGRKVVIASIYAPNTDQAVFLDDMSRVIAPWHDMPMLLGDYYNSVLDASLDPSFPSLPGTNTHIAMKALINWANQ